jgi:hypothetical protein
MPKRYLEGGRKTMKKTKKIKAKKTKKDQKKKIVTTAAEIDAVDKALEEVKKGQYSELDLDQLS